MVVCAAADLDCGRPQRKSSSFRLKSSSTSPSCRYSGLSAVQLSFPCPCSLEIISLNFWAKFKLFVVMILVPIIGNIIQFWITDTILKKKDWSERDRLVRKYYFLENEEIGNTEYAAKKSKHTLSPTTSKDNLSELESQEVSVEALREDLEVSSKNFS